MKMILKAIVLAAAVLSTQTANANNLKIKKETWEVIASSKCVLAWSKDGPKGDGDMKLSGIVVKPGKYIIVSHKIWNDNGLGGSCTTTVTKFKVESDQMWFYN